MMLYVISFLAPFTRLSSKQNADAISKGYQFMQQFALSLKASLAPEANALERKSGEALCYLLQLSPSALLQSAKCTPSGEGELAAPNSKHWGARIETEFCPIHPSSTYSCILHRTKTCCAHTADSEPLGGFSQGKQMKKEPAHFLS